MKKIMLVDDEMHILRILKLSLQKKGYEVETYSNGADALAALHRGVPDVLITDIQMPRMTGEELCKQIEIDFPNRSFVIYIVTSRTEVEHREWSADIYNLRFLEKPVSMKNLLLELQNYFDNLAIE